MRVIRSRSTLTLLACLLSYTLLATLLALPSSRAESLGRTARGIGRVMGGMPVPAVQAEAPRREGELLVRFSVGVTERSRDDIASSAGARRKSKLRGNSLLEKLELQPGQDAAAVAAQLSRRPGVELAEPNFLVRHDEVTPNDTRFSEQWALRNTGQNGGAVGSDVRAAAAWRETTGSASTVVAVIDSGIDFTHPDLDGNRWVNQAEVVDNGLDDERDGYVDDVSGWDWVAGAGIIRDEQGHGTSVAGIIAAEGNNRAGVSGVMWRASLMSLRVLDSTGAGDVASAVEAIDYAAAHGAQVVNCSWGTDAESLALRDAIERAGRRGVVVIASAGNSSRDIDARPYYPASFDLPNLIAVASSDGFDNLAQFSNHGATRVTVAAPGTDILTTQLGGDYRWVSGTSASAPLVAGIAGLLKTARPGVTAAAARAAIMDGVRRVDTLKDKVSSGGVADAGGALAALRGNPYLGGDGGRGNSQGGGQGNGQPYVPPALRHDNDHGRAKGKQGLVVTPPPGVKGAPGANLPNLDESRKVRTSPSTPTASAPIQANLWCADCDPTGGGGGYNSEPEDRYFGSERSAPDNDTGTPGVDLGSRNFNWSLPVVSLPGRSGLDLSLTLYYNSLVWTKQNSAIQYNADHGTPAPGFQLGLPRLQAQYRDTGVYAYTGSAAAASSYMMITPSGGRVELRQTGTAGIYESVDSTYTQLVFSDSAPVVRTTDGTQYAFGAQVGAEWRCTQIKDRNGNYISATYNTANGHLLSVTDTLGRVLNFNYDADGNLSTITQAWGLTTHTYATFIYGSVPMAPNFNNLAVYGLPGGGSQVVLSFVVFPDNESYHFTYNSYGQVYQITRVAPDGHELAHTRYNMSNADLNAFNGGAQTDCPRFTARYEYAQDWNGGAEALTTYSVADGVQWQDPETLQTETGRLAQQTTPDGTTYKQYSHSSGWDEGLVRLEEVWATENNVQVRKKWTSMEWTQDNVALPYPQNPRLTETNVYDGANRSRTTLEYNQGYGLPTHVREWGGADGQTPLRLSVTEYQLDAAYVARRVIGLPWQRQVYEADGRLASKVQFYYDWGGDDLFRDTPAAATQHDRANYGPAFLAGRGNLSDVIRFDVKDPTNAGGTTQETKFRVSTTGSLLMRRDHSGHATYFDYSDSFSDGLLRNTFAYATAVTDADNYSSSAQYNYDFGSVTRTHAPTSGTGAGTTYADVATSYDSLGRPERVESFVGQAGQGYKRFVYDPSYNYVHTYETLTGLTQADELHSWQVFDGAGRVRAAASDHPNSAGGYSARYFIYDRMGRLAQQYNPTEVNGNWAPLSWSFAGDDSEWYYTTLEYDWKGRTTRAVNADGSTQVFTYGGCGCAGGEVTTAQDEHGRQKRYTKDTLGRLRTVEELNWNGSVYSTTQYAYNARDQITEINQQGQVRSFDYDGHGRLWHRTTPEQGTTTYAYNGDDTVYSVTDARGAKAIYGYTGRHQVSSISYDLSGVLQGQSVAVTSNVSMLYDAAGNRYYMSDGEGYTYFHYDSLSNMDWEERTFTSVGTYRLSYEYNPAGELKKITYPWQFGGVQVTYGYDKAGRLNAVGGSGYAGVTSYADSITYRAFGAVKGMHFGDTKTLTTSYDKRMRVTKWDVSGVLGYKYYYDDFGERTGRVTFAQNINQTNAGLDRAQTASALDRSYEYDHLGRLAISHAGAEARAAVGIGAWGTADGNYSQGYDYDAWGNVTHRYGWGGEVQGGSASSSTDLYYSYVGNRRSGFSYDNSGNLTFDGGQHFAYDAEGRQVSVDWTNLQQGYDGDGLRVRRSEDGTYPARYLRSSVLGGQVVAELDYVGGGWQWQRGYVYAGAGLLAVQQGGVYYVHEDPVTKAKRVTDGSGLLQSATEVDPYGADAGGYNTAFQPRKFATYERDANGTDEAMMRRYNRWHARFDQPDPYEGSYELRDPQSFNRYSYVQGDPVNFGDPTGLDEDVFQINCVGLSCTTPQGFGAQVNVYASSSGSVAGAITGMGFGRGNRLPVTEFEPRGRIGREPQNVISINLQAALNSQGMLPGDKSLWDCLQQQFDNARRERAELQQREAFSIKPSASTLVSAGIGFLGGLVITKSPVGGAVGALALAGGKAIVQDVVAENTIRAAKRIYGSQDIHSRLNWSLSKCYRDNGYASPPGDIAEAIGVLFN